MEGMAKSMIEFRQNKVCIVMIMNDVAWWNFWKHLSSSVQKIKLGRIASCMRHSSSNLTERFVSATNAGTSISLAFLPQADEMDHMNVE